MKTKIKIVITMLGFTILMSTTCDIPDVNWLSDSATRFELPGSSTSIEPSDASHLFYVDKGGVLFSSQRNKLGYASRDGSTYYFVEWDGDISVGDKSNAYLRTQSGTYRLDNLRIVQYQGGTVWVTYKQASTSTEGRIVQKW